jgi:serine/threonine-protein kinase
MDFGIARALASGASTMTQTSAVIGTAQYLSPEQARGESVDARSDVYATGCVLYELLCGQPPFVGDSPVSVAYQHVREDAKAPSLMNRDVPPAVDAVVLKALAKNPLNRYQSAGEMRADLLRAAQGRPVYAEPVQSDTDGSGRTRVAAGSRPGVPARVGNQQRRRTSGWAIAGLTALAVLAVVTLVAGLIVSQQPSKKTVPNLIGQTNEQAKTLLRNNGLLADPQSITGTTCTLNQVLSQDPKQNTKIDEGGRVTYQWCAGPGQAKVPSLVGSPQKDAEDALRAAHLEPVADQVDSDKPVGTVVTTDPPANSDVAEGSKVTLHISRGNLKAVPDVSGKGYSEDTAKALLTSNGFVLIETLTVNVTSAAQAGKVQSQDPPAGALRNPTTTTIRIYIGTYSAPSPSGSSSPTP